MTGPCPACDGAGVTVASFHPDDPNAKERACRACGGSGEVTIRCDGCAAGPPAVVCIAGEYFCGACLARQSKPEMQKCA